MTFGLTPLGFNAKRLADIKQDLENAMISQFGEVNIDPQSVFGQQIGVLSKQFADLWENLEAVYQSQYPNSASGISLDNVVQYNGITRLQAQQTSVIGVCTGNESTLVPAGSLVRIPNTNNIFSNPTSGLISRENAYSVTINVVALAAQVYTTIINNQLFSYSLPIITFTGDFDPLGTTTVTLNGVQLAPVPYNTDQATTLSDVAASIAASPAVASVSTPDTHTIKIVPNLGFSVTVNFITFGAGTPPTYAITFDTPGALSTVAQYITAVINAQATTFTATYSGPNFVVVSDDPGVPFVASVQPNLNITSQTSPITFLCQVTGPIPCPVGSLTEILTPIAGWSDITNPVAGVTGRFVETDAELRIRRAQSIRLAGNATVEAIRAKLLQNVPGVTSALVFENQDMVQSEIDIVFTAPFVTGNAIIITLNSSALPTINYSTSNLFTMTQLALLLSQQPEIASCVVTGTGNNTLALTMNIFQSVLINGISITGGASQPQYTIKGGRPPKSFEAVVEGGANQVIGNQIWLSKPAGIATFGNQTVNVTDSQGGNQVIFFSRPTPVYLWVNMTLTLYSEETFPPNGIELVREAILAYGESLGIGVDVLLQRVQCQIFTVPGVASASVCQLANTITPTQSPSFGTSDIPIADNEISVWDINRITVTV
jgi:uncharacterized phage protein gp47/JayE